MRIRLALIASFLMVPLVSFARSSIATVEGHPELTYITWEAVDQQAADRGAISGCRELAEKQGHAAAASLCVVVHRQSRAGFGAASCGAQRCEWVTGAKYKQSAMDMAFMICEAKQTGTCSDDVMIWEDTTGYVEQKCDSRSPLGCK